MRTPVVLVSGQGDTDGVVDTLIHRPATVVVSHRFDGQVVVRTVTTYQGPHRDVSECPLEVRNGCIDCTVRNDLLALLRRLHRRPDVARIVVQLMDWVEPEQICWAIEVVQVRLGNGYVDGPACRDVAVHGVVTCVDAENWLPQALGDDELDDGRAVADVVVDQAEFADVLVLDAPEPSTLAVLRRLTPRARLTVGADRVELSLANLEPDARRGRRSRPHDPLLAGQPPLQPEGAVSIVEFYSRRPFHPQRLHDVMDELLDGVVRLRGRAWLASQPDTVVWAESAGGRMHLGSAGRWLAAMSARERAYVDPERQALAAADWNDVTGDRQIAMTALLCGARRENVTRALNRALLTDDELARPADWRRFPDPFGDWHQNPGEALVNADDAQERRTGND